MYTIKKGLVCSDDVLISIIIPTFKRVEKLKRALFSILSQTIKEYEIIIINDDEKCIYEEISEFLRKQNHLYLHNKINRGLSFNRNLGMEKATGRYLIFLDDDDYLKNNYFELALKAFNKYRADVVYFNALVIGETLAPESIFDHPFNKEKLQYYNFICPVSIILKKPKLTTTKFDESLKMSEDWDFWLQLLLNEKFRFHHEPLDMCYYDRSTSDSMTCNENQLNVARTYYSCYLQIIEKFKNNRDSDAEYLTLFIDKYYKERIKRLSERKNVCRFSYEKLIKKLSECNHKSLIEENEFNYIFGVE